MFLCRFSSSASLSEAYHKAYDNCDLSDADLIDLEPQRDLIDDRNYDSWQRVSYMKPCDVIINSIVDTTGTISMILQLAKNLNNHIIL